MKKNVLLFTALCLWPFFSNLQAAEAIEVDCSEKIPALILNVDYSGSMMQAPKKDHEGREAPKEGKSGLLTSEEFYENPKIRSVKLLIEELDKHLKDKGIPVSLTTNSPFTQVFPVEQDDKSSLTEATQRLQEDLEVVGRRSSLGFAINKMRENLSGSEAKGTILVFTDADVNRGRKIVEGDDREYEADESDQTEAALDLFYKQHPQACLVVVSLAQKEKAKELVKLIGSRRGCPSSAEFKDLMTDNAKLEDFVSDVLYKDCVRTFSLHGINFGFDKYNIDAKGEEILKKALDTINTYAPNSNIKIVGWTDSKGSDSYNKKLSYQRANAVRDWLIKEGLSPEKLSAVGAGKSFKYENQTENGRYMNRRIDIVFE